MHRRFYGQRVSAVLLFLPVNADCSKSIHTMSSHHNLLMAALEQTR